MNTAVQKLKEAVTEASKSPAFMHRDWYVQYHLEIVEKIALELCDIYNEADRYTVLALVWIHDYGKILDRDNQYGLNGKSKELLLDIGFTLEQTDHIITYLEIMEKKMEIDLHAAPIEVQIVSSADAASHMVGPFMPIYWKEFATKDISEILKDNIKKLTKDWERKITLPEVKEKFLQRHNFLLEQSGTIPEKFF